MIGCSFGDDNINEIDSLFKYTMENILSFSFLKWMVRWKGLLFIFSLYWFANNNNDTKNYEYILIQVNDRNSRTFCFFRKNFCFFCWTLKSCRSVNTHHSHTQTLYNNNTYNMPHMDNWFKCFNLFLDYSISLLGDLPSFFDWILCNYSSSALLLFFLFR